MHSESNDRHDREKREKVVVPPSLQSAGSDALM